MSVESSGVYQLDSMIHNKLASHLFNCLGMCPEDSELPSQVSCLPIAMAVGLQPAEGVTYVDRIEQTPDQQSTDQLLLHRRGKKEISSSCLV